MRRAPTIVIDRIGRRQRPGAGPEPILPDELLATRAPRLTRLETRYGYQGHQPDHQDGADQPRFSRTSTNVIRYRDITRADGG